MRPIDEIILHCTATPEGREVSVEEIDRWHRERDFKEIGYHYVIHLDGRVGEGRAVEKIGAHVKGHNSRTIGVAYVGGLDKYRKPKDTRTQKQKDAFVKLIKDLDARFHFKKLSGHKEYANKACPCFDVAPYRKLLGSADAQYVSDEDSVLGLGDKGPAVAAWCQKLASAGYDIPEGDEFDMVVERATRNFQAKRGIVIDGLVGPQTEEEMLRFLDGRPPDEVLARDLAIGPLFERKAPRIMADLISDLGISIEDAAAILGNIGHECAGFKHLSQINGSAYGWPQWDGVRRKAYFDWCRKKRLDKASDEANYGFLVHELRTTHERALDKLAEADGLDAKTIAFELSFEKAGIKHYPSRQKYADRALEAYKRAIAGGVPIQEVPTDRVDTIAELQSSLKFLGGNVGKVDNILGPRTEAAIKRFEKLSRLPITGRPSPTVMAAVQAVYLALGGR